MHPDINIYLADVDCIVLSRLRILGGETPPTPGQPSTPIANDTVLHQALGNEINHCSTTLLAIKGDRVMLSKSELCHSRDVSSYW